MVRGISSSLLRHVFDSGLRCTDATYGVHTLANSELPSRQQSSAATAIFPRPRQKKMKYSHTRIIRWRFCRRFSAQYSIENKKLHGKHKGSYQNSDGRIKAIRMLFVMTMVFGLLWTPFVMMRIVVIAGHPISSHMFRFSEVHILSSTAADSFTLS